MNRRELLTFVAALPLVAVLSRGRRYPRLHDYQARALREWPRTSVSILHPDGSVTFHPVKL